ncbi:hypothetical protein MKX42_23835 [Paenibacillus sp. FSL R7-0204]|uniref:hypothetical protein n=1 Tax=Paenibacillus sp. FSL R7-0204 TaxID=2921675 RepID=UPI0030F90101
MPISKSEAGARLGVKQPSIDHLIKQGRLDVVSVTTSHTVKDKVTEKSLYTELAERHRLFGNALSLTDDSEQCLCGCGAKTNQGKYYLAGHDQKLEGIIKFFLINGNSLDHQLAVSLAMSRNINIHALLTRGF